MLFSPSESVRKTENPRLFLRQFSVKNHFQQNRNTVVVEDAGVQNFELKSRPVRFLFSSLNWS